MASRAAAGRRPGSIGRRGCVVALSLLCSGLRAQTAAVRGAAEQAQAIDRAAFQRALSQRLTKAYLMVAQGIEAELGKRILDESSAAFERNLAWLKGVAPSAEASKRLNAVAERWPDFLAVLVRPADRAGAEALYRKSDELEATAHRATIAFEAAYASPTARGLMLAGRLRMLSERMAKFWLYRRWGLFTEAADMEMHLARAHFTAILVQVERLDLAPPAVAAIGVLRRDWPAYDALLQAPAAAPAELVRRSEQTLANAQAQVDAMMAPVAGAPAAKPAATSSGRP